MADKKPESLPPLFTTTTFPFPDITLRDLFAAAAISNEAYSAYETKAEEIAASAYAVADAMLAEREKGE